MKIRNYWIRKIQKSWQKRSVIWLSGVRRVGKTCLCRSLPGVEYFDCELPRVRNMMEDVEGFLRNLKGRSIILDEIHRLGNPSEILKIAADHYPDIRIIATGSSSLGSSAKFRDTLTGRKSEVWLTPMLQTDLADFGVENLEKRCLLGGLPPFLMSDIFPEKEFQEWMDGYWAKDIQELFRLERRYAFQRFVELLMVQSGGIFEASSFTKQCEVSRTTISNYLAVLDATYVVHIIRPFSTHKATEIVAAPKIYGFDTGFVCYYRGWSQLRRDDMGLLWEHLVLNDIHGHLQTRNVYYWRDKRGHEIDFILAGRGTPPTAIECKWSSAEFDPKNLKLFRQKYPEGRSFVVAQDVEKSFTKYFGNVVVEFVNLQGLMNQVHSGI